MAVKQAVHEPVSNSEHQPAIVRTPGIRELAQLEALFKDMKLGRMMSTPNPDGCEGGFLVSVNGKSELITGGLFYRINGRARDIEISIVAVRGESKGQGIGSALVMDALEIGREKGCKSASLSLLDETLAPFYEALGFHRVERDGLELRMSRRL